MTHSGIRTRLILFGAPVVVATALLQWEDGGYELPEWGAAALLFLALLAIAALAGLPSGLGSLAIVISVTFLGAYTVWNFLSISWAEVQGDALDGANRTLLYLLLYSLVVLLPWRAETAVVLLGAGAVLAAGLGIASLLLAALVPDPDAYFIAGRFSAPMGYQNGNCALFLMGFFAALPLSCRRELSPPARAVLLASAGVLLQLAILTQSRASLGAAPLTFAVLLLLFPGRLRLLAALVPIGLAAAVSADLLLDVFFAVRTEDADPQALDSAAIAVGATAPALLVVGLVAALLDRRLELPVGAARVATLAVVVAAAAMMVVAVGVLVARVDHPIRSVERAWSSFKEIQEPGETREFDSSYYLGSGIGGNRYDLWRVALEQFRAHPVIGVGSENFAVDYLRERRTFEETLHPHSLPLRVLAQTGVVGALLLAGAFGAALVAAAAALRRRGPPAVAAATALTVFTYWFAHGAVDWFWELPGLGVPAFAALGLAASLARRADRPPRGRVHPALLKLATVGALVLAAATLAPTWLAAKETEAAGVRWRAASGEAFSRLERARALNPLSEKPDLFAAVIAGKLGDHARMRMHLARAIERKPTSWYAHFELALLEGATGDREAALTELDLAAGLNPLEPAIHRLRDQLLAGETPSLEEYDRLFLERARAVGK